MSSNFVLKTELKEVLNLKFSGSSIQVFHTLVREEEDPTSAGEPEGSWRGTEAGRLCPGCMLNGSRSKIWSRTMTASSHKVRRCFVWTHNLALTTSETIFPLDLEGLVSKCGRFCFIGKGLIPQKNHSFMSKSSIWTLLFRRIFIPEINTKVKAANVVFNMTKAPRVLAIGEW